mgnify:CR=1 FL=1
MDGIKIVKANIGCIVLGFASTTSYMISSEYITILMWLVILGVYLGYLNKFMKRNTARILL